MKTKITIEIETELNKIYGLDEQGELDESPENEVTNQVDKKFHELIDSEIRQFIEEKLESNIMDNADFDYMVDDYDSFRDYGKFKITISTEEN